jgi:hypothetical protein
MRVVSIAEEQPKVLAKYTFDAKMTGLLSSPEGHVLFVWRFGSVGYSTEYIYVRVRTYTEIGCRIRILNLYF